MFGPAVYGFDPNLSHGHVSENLQREDEVEDSNSKSWFDLSSVLFRDPEKIIERIEETENVIIIVTKKDWKGRMVIFVVVLYVVQYGHVIWSACGSSLSVPIPIDMKQM